MQTTQISWLRIPSKRGLKKLDKGNVSAESRLFKTAKRLNVFVDLMTIFVRDEVYLTVLVFKRAGQMLCVSAKSPNEYKRKASARRRKKQSTIRIYFYWFSVDPKIIC